MNYFVKHYGEESQLQQLSKEAIELAHSINNFLDNKGSLKEVKEEMADCLNLIEQFETHWNDGEVYSIKLAKQQRQKERIKNNAKV